jgi:hypothetical protein
MSFARDNSLFSPKFRASRKVGVNNIVEILLDWPRSGSQTWRTGSEPEPDLRFRVQVREIFEPEPLSWAPESWGPFLTEEFPKKEIGPV